MAKISTVTSLQASIGDRAGTVSPAFTGTPTAPTAVAGTNTTQLATTAFVTTADNLKANIASPTFTGLPTAPNYAVTVGGTRTFGYSVSVDHQAGNAGSVGLTITDGGNAAGVFVVNSHDGTYSSQEVVIKTAKGGTSLSTEYLRVKSDGKIIFNTAILTNAANDAAAAGAGVAVGGLYRNGSALMVRIV